MRSAIASVYLQQRRRSLAQAVRMRASKPWRGAPELESERSTALPTREALYEAVYQHEVQQLWELAERLKEEVSPMEALRRGMRAIVEFVATKKGMSAALALAVTGFSELHARSSPRLEKAARTLLERAVAAGEIRADIDPGDLMRAVVGMCLVHNQPGWQASVLPLVDVLVDGLRVGAKQRNAVVGKRSATRRRVLASKPAIR